MYPDLDPGRKQDNGSNGGAAGQFRFAYIALTGKNCYIDDVHIEKAEGPVPDGYIPRIAEEISFIDGPEGDIPNVQVDSVRSAASEGVPVEDQVVFSFHAMSLPTARLIWHCPYIVLFHSADGQVNGKGYLEYALVRLDGENWENENHIQSQIVVNREDDFEGWDAWKRKNKEGFDCRVRIIRKDNKILISTQNFGLSVTSTTIIPEKMLNKNTPVFAALTGDQCALTNIRITESKDERT